mmetsp:Transcript_3547/g.8894  ORF Transcript_3547/g.8894 Transcript_3547/m.8894 type:complete len:215 (-) Transcript_3547:297-941(-)
MRHRRMLQPCGAIARQQQVAADAAAVQLDLAPAAALVSAAQSRLAPRSDPQARGIAAPLGGWRGRAGVGRRLARAGRSESSSRRALDGARCGRAARCHSPPAQHRRRLRSLHRRHSARGAAGVQSHARGVGPARAHGGVWRGRGRGVLLDGRLAWSHRATTRAHGVARPEGVHAATGQPLPPCRQRPARPGAAQLAPTRHAQLLARALVARSLQ